jgi:hypothetical protein
MRLSLAAVALVSSAPAVLGFSTQTTKVFSSALGSTIDPPERTAPDAGFVPEWEDRPGLSPEEFIASDMSKPDLSGMWECPLTKWDSDGYVGKGRLCATRWNKSGNDVLRITVCLRPEPT